MKVVTLSAPRIGRLHSPQPHPKNIPCIHFYQRLSRPEGHSAARGIMSIKNSSDSIGHWNRNLPACSAVPQPTALLRATVRYITYEIIYFNLCLNICISFSLYAVVCSVPLYTSFANTAKILSLIVLVKKLADDQNVATNQCGTHSSFSFFFISLLV